LPRNVLEDLEPARVRQRLGDSLELIGIHHYRFENDMIDR